MSSVEAYLTKSIRLNSAAHALFDSTAIARSMGLPTAAQILAIRPRRKFGAEVVSAVRDMGSEPTRTAFRSPWQNGVAERWVGSCRRDLLDLSTRKTSGESDLGRPVSVVAESRLRVSPRHSPFYCRFQ